MRKLLTLCCALALVLTLSLSASAAGFEYVIDDAGLLTEQERWELNALADAISREYGIGIYLMSVDNYYLYGEEAEIFDVLWNYYHDNSLGYGPNREGMILMLSMAERDFATFFYGEKTEYAFNSYGQEELEDYFLDNFGDNDWYGGFFDYLTCSEDFMARAAAGEPVRENPWGLAIVFIMIAVAIALIVTLILWGQKSNVALQAGADRYLAGGLALSRTSDRFLTQTVTRRKIQTNTSSGSGGSRSFSGGGGSGRSGKF